MLQMSPIEMVPRDEGRGLKGGATAKGPESRGHGRRENAARCRAKEGTLGWWWGCRKVTVNQIRRREREKKMVMRTRTRAVGPLAPHQNRDSGIASLRMAFNPGRVRRGFLGASIEGGHWLGGAAKSRKFPGLLGSVSHCWKRFENSVASTLRCQVAPRTRRLATRDDGWGPLFSRGASKHFSICAGKGAGSLDVWVARGAFEALIDMEDVDGEEDKALKKWN